MSGLVNVSTPEHMSMRSTYKKIETAGRFSGVIANFDIVSQARVGGICGKKKDGVGRSLVWVRAECQVAIIDTTRRVAPYSQYVIEIQSERATGKREHLHLR